MGTIKGRIKKTYSQISGKELYIRRPVIYSTIDENELLRLASVDSQIPIATLQQIFDGIRVQFSELLLNGHTVQLGELGSFRLSISARAVANEEQVSVDNVRTRRIVFLPSKTLKQKIESTNIQSEVAQGIMSFSKMLPAKFGDLNNTTITFILDTKKSAVAQHLKMVASDGSSDKFFIEFSADGNIKVKGDVIGTWVFEEGEVFISSSLQQGTGPTVAQIKWV